jgi:hypothetical protein
MLHSHNNAFQSGIQKLAIINKLILLSGDLYMAEPISYISAKIAAMVGGFLGGAAILTFIRPKSIGEAFMRGGVSVGSAIVFSTPLLDLINMNPNWENQAMAGFIVGFVAYGVLGMVANFLVKYQTKDIVEVVKEVKGGGDKNKEEQKVVIVIEKDKE